MKTIIEEMEKKEKIDNFKVEFKNSKKLKSFLQSAMNTATSLTSYIPKITDELIIVINQYQKSQKEKINLKDNKERFDTFKSLRQFAYGLVDYDPSIKANKIGSFEMVVERSIHSALMSVNKFGSIDLEFNTIEPPINPEGAIVDFICDTSANPIGFRKNTASLNQYTYDLRVFEERYNVIIIKSGRIGLMMAR